MYYDWRDADLIVKTTGTYWERDDARADCEAMGRK